MYKEKAIEKIQKELKAFTGGNKEKAVSKPVAETLEMFCKQNEEFAQAIYESDKTLSNCCKTIMEKAEMRYLISKFTNEPSNTTFQQPTLKCR